jgi:AAA domain
MRNKKEDNMTITIDTKTSTSVSWLVKDLLPEGHKCMIATLEGGCKTFMLCWAAVCVASGNPMFGFDTKKGNVLMIDEETTPNTIHRRLNRFCQGIGLKGIEDLPNLIVKPMGGFRFARANSEILKLIEDLKPALITIDSVLACLPGGRQGMGENSAETGIAIRDDLNKMLQVSPSSTILIAAHSAKTTVSQFDIEEYREAEMTSLVRGHGSIVGQACDTGFGLLKISEKPSPTRFVIIPKPRREAIPSPEIFVELTEESYGNGWARLVKIAPVPIPPSQVAVDIFTLFKNEVTWSASQIKGKASGKYAAAEIRQGIEQLLRRQVIVTSSDNFTFDLNPDIERKADSEYLKKLREAVRQV